MAHFKSCMYFLKCFYEREFLDKATELNISFIKDLNITHCLDQGY
jgi:hypothetical protein